MSINDSIDDFALWMEGALQPNPPAPVSDSRDWLSEHDYVEDDGQPEDDESDALKDTLLFFVQEDGYNLHAPDFELQFRAYLHNNDYSYSAGQVKRAIEQIKGKLR